MQPLLASVPTFAVAIIYCLYNIYRQDRQRRELSRLRKRVAYLLWVLATEVDDPEPDAGFLTTCCSARTEDDRPRQTDWE
jgi:hypothetical protein